MASAAERIEKKTEPATDNSAQTVCGRTIVPNEQHKSVANGNGKIAMVRQVSEVEVLK